MDVEQLKRWRLILGGSSPKLAKWLGDIRTSFTENVVSVIQQDAIERRGMDQLLLEPEMLKNVQPNVHLVGTQMSLGGRIPERTKETAWSCGRSSNASGFHWNSRFARP